MQNLFERSHTALPLGRTQNAHGTVITMHQNNSVAVYTEQSIHLHIFRPYSLSALCAGLHASTGTTTPWSPIV